jgi:hypothetical protein
LVTVTLRACACACDKVKVAWLNDRYVNAYVKADDDAPDAPDTPDQTDKRSRKKPVLKRHGMWKPKGVN